MARRIGALIFAASLVAGTAGAQTPSSSMVARQIDCPATAPTGSPGAVGTPQGAGQGSGLTAMPSKGEKRVEGSIKAIGSTRTNRVVEVADVKLEVEPTTAVLVNCKPATVADLKTGLKVKAVYEVKDSNRNVAMVIEAQR